MAKKDQFVKLIQLTALPDVARILDVSEEFLQSLVDSGVVRAAEIMPQGDIYVSFESARCHVLNQKLETIERSQFDELNDRLITANDAALKYNVPVRTIRKWALTRYVWGDDSRPVRLNEGDIAYCAAVFNVRKDGDMLGGAPLLEQDGKPYKLRNPYLSARRHSLRG